MKKIINAKKENKKIINDYKKKEQDKFNLIRKKIQENRQIQMNNLNNSLLKRRENLNEKIQILKKNKNSIKTKINTNNNNLLYNNKLKYEKAKTNMIFNKDKNIILKAEKEDKKRKDRLSIINREKMENISLEKNIEQLEQEEEKYLNLIKQTQLLKQKLNNSSFNNNYEKRIFINRNKKNKELAKFNNSNNNKQLIQLKVENNYCKNKVLNICGDVHLRTFHNSLDLDDNYFNKKKNFLKYEKEINKSLDKKATINFENKSCYNRNKNLNLSFDKINKDKLSYNNISQRTKKIGLRQKIIDKIVNIKLKSNLENENK